MKFLLIFFALCSSLVVCGQDDVEVPMPSQGSRSSYIKGYPDHFFVWPVLKQRRQDFDFRQKSGDKTRLSYRSNKPYSLGVGAYVFELAVEFAFAIPLAEQNKRIYGESRARDLQLNVIGRRWGFDVFYQRYAGFYITDSENPVAHNMPYPQRPDIGTRNTGASVSYIFDKNRFSFRSPYNFSERQLRSGGSFVAFGTLRSFRISGDSALADPWYSRIFPDLVAVQDLRVLTAGVAPGYTYNLVYNGFFLNGTLGVGPGVNLLRYEYENGASNNHGNFSTLVTARLALGYNGDRIFGGMTFINQGGRAGLEDVELNSSNSTFKVMVGYRFNETGILKKRVWDLPESLLN